MQKMCLKQTKLLVLLHYYAFMEQRLSLCSTQTLKQIPQLSYKVSKDLSRSVTSAECFVIVRER
jgi:hypothetical protein